MIGLPGSVAPAADRYAPLVAAIGDRAALHLKELELYRAEAPPEDYSTEMELDAVDRLAASLGLDRFHLVGYSAGGYLALAYAGTRPKRLLTLSVFEPARVPGSLTEFERNFLAHLDAKLSGLQGSDFMSAFIQEQVKPGAVLPPPPPPNPEMRKRPAGIAALLRAFEAYSFDRDQLRRCSFPVSYGYGDLSHEEQAVKAGVLAQLFPDFHVQRFDGIHHFVAPAAIYTARYAGSLLDMWERAQEQAQPLARPL